MSVDVSVIVPVFNTGPFIEACIESLLAQTLPRERCELVFVDDGSTDGTPARLDRLAVDAPNVVVRHEPNSGWPGRPRNVGIDVARGDYVFFCDHDDWLADEALERMLAFARRTDADVLIPKMVGHGRGVPTELFRRNRDRATPWTAPLMSSLTPHKLFRRAFLDEQGLRFPEGRRRLEDHVFVVAAYLSAHNVAVLADYPAYHHIRRPDGGNAASQQIDPGGYFGNLAEVIDIIEARVPTGPDRDRLLQRPFLNEMLHRLGSRTFLTAPPEQQAGMLAAIRDLLLARFPASYGEDMGAVVRIRAAATRAGDLETLVALAARVTAMTADARLADVRRDGTGWVASIEAELVDADGAPMRVRRAADGGWLPDPRLVPHGVQTRPDTSAQLTSATASVVLVEADTDEEWYLEDTLSGELREEADAARLVLTGAVRLDPTVAAAGGPIPPGSYQVRVRVHAVGTSAQTRVRVARPEAVDAVGPAPAPGDRGQARLVVKGRAHRLRLEVGHAP